MTPDVQGQMKWDGSGEDLWNNEIFEVEDMALGMIKMKSGAVINLKAAWAVNIDEEAGANSEATVLLAGTKGGLNTIDSRVRLNHVVANRKTISYVGDKAVAALPGFSNGTPQKSEEARIWVNALKGNGELFVTAEQAYVVSRILDAIYKSSVSGKPVYFD